jgi:hypothetical protein
MMVKDKSSFRWDVFVSHSSAQKPLVRAIVHQWRELGLSVFFDDDTIQPGEDVVTALDRARENSRRTVLLITPESIASRWVDQEVKGVVYLDPGAAEGRLIPVLLEPVADSDIPLSIRKLSRIDLTVKAETLRESHRLLKSLGVSARSLPDLPWLATKGAAIAPPSLLGPQLELGAMPTDSPYYIERQVERTIARLVGNPGATVTIKGYRQSGMSSLLSRLHARVIDADCASCILDFQGMVPQTFRAAKDFFPALAQSIADGLDLDVDSSKVWAARRDAAQNLTIFLEKQVLALLDRPILLLFDQPDLTLPHREVCGALFSTLRYWHDRRADVRRGTSWRRVGLVVAHTTEPSLWLEDPNRSPFINVAQAFHLDDFDESEVADLSARYGRILQGKAEVEGLMKLIGGHPYLIRLALHTMARKPCTFAVLKSKAMDEDGPFASHLGHFLNILHNEHSLLACVIKILKYGKCDDEILFQRLSSVGLIRGVTRQKVRLRYAIYDTYFRTKLL